MRYRTNGNIIVRVDSYRKTGDTKSRGLGRTGFFGGDLI